MSEQLVASTVAELVKHHAVASTPDKLWADGPFNVSRPDRKPFPDTESASV